MGDRLAIAGGPAVRTKPWSSWPLSGESEERALVEVLRSRKWGVGGARVPELAERFAALHEAKHAVCCANGTVALEIALVAAGVAPGDEVITSPYTFMATALSILTIGAVPVFVDVCEETHNLDPELIDAAVTDRTKALLPVHIGGRPADMDAMLEIAARRGLVVVEDAAQAWLASWSGRRVGALGDAGTFSFQSSKNLSSGEGGIVLTNDEELYKRAWSYHNCGRTLEGAWYEHTVAGLNYRLTEFQAALLLCALDRLDEEQERRRRSIDALSHGLAPIAGIEVPAPDDRVTEHGSHIFMVRIDPDLVPAPRDVIVDSLRAEGVPVSPGYTTPLHEQSFFEWFRARSVTREQTWGELYGAMLDRLELPICRKLCDTTIWIKQEVLLAGPGEMADVVESFDKVMARARSGEISSVRR